MSPKRLSTRLAALLVLVAFGRTPAWAQNSVVDSYGGRDIIVYAPALLPEPGARALVVVLHGGLGNAERVASHQSESALNMDAVADKGGFLVAYLNGTPVTRMSGVKMLGWNAGGGCCGQAAENAVDDVTYIKGAIDYLASRYGINRARIYGMGHSNGAMMTERLMCETNLYAAAVAVSGPLNLDNPRCVPSRGKRILAIHGADDQNVPLAGGLGAKGLARVAYKSEASTQQAFAAAGASYTLDVVPGADHKLDHIDAVIMKTEGVTLAEKSARFFGLLGKPQGGTGLFR
jgi:polyhydroxybutyrate depolymerase